MSTDGQTERTQDHITGEINRAMFLYAVRHAWPAGDGQWVIRFDAPTENEQLQKQFISQLLRCLLTPPEQHERNGIVRDAIADTTDLSLLDEGDERTP